MTSRRPAGVPGSKSRSPRTSRSPPSRTSRQRALGALKRTTSQSGCEAREGQIKIVAAETSDADASFGRDTLIAREAAWVAVQGFHRCPTAPDHGQTQVEAVVGVHVRARTRQRLAVHPVAVRVRRIRGALGRA